MIAQTQSLAKSQSRYQMELLHSVSSSESSPSSFVPLSTLDFPSWVSNNECALYSCSPLLERNLEIRLTSSVKLRFPHGKGVGVRGTLRHPSPPRIFSGLNLNPSHSHLRHVVCQSEYNKSQKGDYNPLRLYPSLNFLEPIREGNSRHKHGKPQNYEKESKNGAERLLPSYHPF